MCGEFCFIMIGRANIKGSENYIAMNCWLPQASYFRYLLLKTQKVRRIVRSRFHSLFSYWKSRSSKLCPSAPQKVPPWAHLRMFALPFDRYIVEQVVPTQHGQVLDACSQEWESLGTCLSPPLHPAPPSPPALLPHWVSEKTIRVVKFH